jgi:hypothetical protein
MTADMLIAKEESKIPFSVSYKAMCGDTVPVCGPVINSMNTNCSTSPTLRLMS